VPIEYRKRLRGLTALLAALALLPACGTDADDGSSGKTPTRRTPTTTTPMAASTTTAVATSPTAQAPRTEKWIDLEVGECLADPPPTDPSVVTVAIVDCATPHAAEVYLRAATAVNTAIADVADRKCEVGFSQYTGRPVDGSPFTVTYLIDSHQNRTSSNPDPSTVICLLQAANGQPLTESARR